MKPNHRTDNRHVRWMVLGLFLVLGSSITLVANSHAVDAKKLSSPVTLELEASDSKGDYQLEPAEEWLKSQFEAIAASNREPAAHKRAKAI